VIPSFGAFKVLAEIMKERFLAFFEKYRAAALDLDEEYLKEEERELEGYSDTMRDTKGVAVAYSATVDEREGSCRRNRLGCLRSRAWAADAERSIRTGALERSSCLGVLSGSGSGRTAKPDYQD
jgi:hypothetical protein